LQSNQWGFHSITSGGSNYPVLFKLLACWYSDCLDFISELNTFFSYSFLCFIYSIIYLLREYKFSNSVYSNHNSEPFIIWLPKLSSQVTDVPSFPATKVLNRWNLAQSLENGINTANSVFSVSLGTNLAGSHNLNHEGSWPSEIIVSLTLEFSFTSRFLKFQVNGIFGVKSKFGGTIMVFVNGTIVYKLYPNTNLRVS